MRAARVESGSPALAPRITGNEYFLLPLVGRSIKTPPGSTREMREPTRAKAIGDKAHYAGRFHPGNLLQLRFSLRQGYEENVAPDVSTEDFHDLRTADVVSAGNLDVVAGIDAESPGARAVAIERRAGDSCHQQNGESNKGPLQPVESLLWECAATNGNPLLGA